MVARSRWSGLFVFLLCVGYGTTQEFCSSRTLEGQAADIDSQVSDCPYEVYAEGWTAGEPVAMELSALSSGMNTTFQTFLVSVQLGSSLIGMMSTDNNNTELTCRNTSVKNSDMSSKRTASFSWTAPETLGSNEQVIVRYSVGESSEVFWMDCGAFLLSSAVSENAPTAEGETQGETTQPPETTTRRVAGPDFRNERTAAPTSSVNSTSTRSAGGRRNFSTVAPPKIVSDTACYQAGTTYSVVPNTNCNKFKMSWDNREAILNCPAGLRFTVVSCTCGYGDCNV